MSRASGTTTSRSIGRSGTPTAARTAGSSMLGLDHAEAAPGVPGFVGAAPGKQPDGHLRARRPPQRVSIPAEGLAGRLPEFGRLLPVLFRLADRQHPPTRQPRTARLRRQLGRRQPHRDVVDHPPGGARRLDLVGFTYHHSLAPLLPKPVLRKRSRSSSRRGGRHGTAMRTSATTHGGSSPPRWHSPPASSTSSPTKDTMGDRRQPPSVAHLPDLFQQLRSGRQPVRIYSSPPNRADQLGPAPTTGWWHSEPNPRQRRLERLPVRLSTPG